MAVFIWWLLLQAMGWATLPLLFRLLRWLPDRGYSVAKPAGLLLGNYVLWLLGNLGWLRNTEGGILIAFGIVAAFGLWVYQRWNDGAWLIEWLRANRRWVLAYELVFLVALIGWAIFRAHNPDLSTTEKPMEFAFMNAISRSPALPPPDPWLSGFSISYYYFGYVMMSTLMKLSAVSSGVAFSLSNALWFALTAAGAFGIVANLVAASKRATVNAIVMTGLLGALFVSALGNFQGPLEVAHANGVGSPEFWRWLDIQEINTPPRIPTADAANWPFCDPSDCLHPRGGWWFWRASRVVHDYPLGSDRSDPAEYQELIDEFPFFSFLLGDMHPHVLALPYALMSMALALNLFRMAATGPPTAGNASNSRWRQWFWDAAPIVVLYPIFLGALSFLNTWDFPIHVFIVALAWGLGRWMVEGHEARSETGASRSIWTDALLALVACGLIGVVAYLPFYLGFRSQAAGIVPNIYNPTRLPQFFVMFGPFLLIGGSFILTLSIRAVRQRRLTVARAWGGTLSGGAGIVIAATVVAAAASILVLAVSNGARDKLDELTGVSEAQGYSLAQVLVERAGDFWTPLFLGAAMAAVVLIVRARSDNDREDQQASQGAASDSIVPFALLLLGVGALLAFAVEYVYILDFFGTRMNTVFKFYYQAWALWGVGSAYVVYHLWQSRERLTGSVSRLAFAAITAVSLLGGLAYPWLAIRSGTVGRPLHEVTDSQTGERYLVPIAPTLDARSPTMQFAADEVAAINWIEQNAPREAVILESVGGSYRSETSRISAWTGLSSVLGWIGHEGQWRGTYDDISPRQEAIDRIYGSSDPVAALEWLREYGVDYVYVGPNEIAKYPPEGLAKFNAIAERIFQQGASTVYRVSGSSGTTAAR